MRAVYPTDQRTHVGGGAGAGNEYEVADQALAAEYVFAKQVARLRHDSFRRDHNDM